MIILILTLLANGSSIFPVKDNPVLSHDLKSCLETLLIVLFYPIDNFTLANQLFEKALQSFETCVLVNNNLCRKLFSSLESPTTFDKCCKVISKKKFQV